MRVLITGAAGLIGSAVCRRLSHREDMELLGLDLRRGPSDRAPREDGLALPPERLTQGDVADYSAVARAVEGVEAVVHLAADPRGDAPWESVHRNNVVGTYNVLEAAHQAGVRRVVLASSVRVMWGYTVDQEPYRTICRGEYEAVERPYPMLDHLAPMRPDGFYASAKAWGESLGRYYADFRGMSLLVVRFGHVTSEDRPWPDVPRSCASWCSQEDAAQMVELCLTAPSSLGWDVFYAVSDNEWRFLDIAHARRVLGYSPVARADGAGVVTFQGRG